jgi:poly-gamma-glutamate capsule biosynthesis protein CapA/YwtB (metallophosphatase superfamily)
MNKVIPKDSHYGGLFFLVQILIFSLALLACRGDARLDTSGQMTSAKPATEQNATPDTIPPQDTVPPAPRTIRIVGVGDMMLGSNYPSPSYLPANGGKDLLTDVKDILTGADVTFGNLEGTIIEKGTMSKSCKDPSKCYAFRSPESYADHFVEAGFDLLSLANNHSGDFGPEGRRRTKELLAERNIKYAGLAGTDEQAILEKDGLKYGFCAFAPNSGTCDIRNISRAKQIVADLAAKTDIVIVSFHGGAEGVSNQNVPKKTETFYGENRGDVHAFAHGVIDAGADIVFGHGPHVTRAMELYNDRFIIYSLGNFCTYGRFSLSGAAGIAPIIEVEVDEKGVFQQGQITPIYQGKTHGPKKDPQKRAITKLIELTNSDFPDTPLQISADGKIEKK